jgi:thiamine biosynthesis lipoprotein
MLSFRVVLASVVTACGTFAGCASDKALERFEFRARKMGTEARIVMYAPSDSLAAGAARAAFARIETIDSLLSDYRKSSEVLHLATVRAAERVSVSTELAAVLAPSLELSSETDGAFDVTAGSVTRLWREARLRGAIPDTAQICGALRAVGWRHIDLDAAERVVRFDIDGIQLDFGGIGKGYAADEALAVMRAFGVSRALIVFGGEIVAGAPPPRARGWPVSVDGSSEPVLLANGALSTSGDEEQFVDVDGTRYSHVIDPRTGWALTSHVSITVQAPTGMLADALATAATVLDSARAELLLARHKTLRPGATLAPLSALPRSSSHPSAPAEAHRPAASACRS